MKKKPCNMPDVFKASPELGLDEGQVKERLAVGLDNKIVKNASKSVGRIIALNLCTVFNLVNFVLFAAVIWVGAYKNALFMVVVTANLAIGIVQELRAKYSAEKLSLVTASRATVVRSGARLRIPNEQVVRDDIIRFTAGNQVVCDCELLVGECEVDESALTGESVPVKKLAGDKLLSGTFITEGACTARAQKVGRDSYLNTLSAGVKRIKLAKSEIMDTFTTIVRFMAVLIFPVGALLTFSQLRLGTEHSVAVVKIVAGLIGMMPEGLILLTSTVLAVGVVRLSQKGVLTRELHCIESLARADVLCLDKTGTLTEGKAEFNRLVPLAGKGEQEIFDAIRIVLDATGDDTETVRAIYAGITDKTEQFSGETARVFPFTSRTKWSGVELQGGETLILGAPDFIMEPSSPTAIEAKRLSLNNRVLLLAQTSERVEIGEGGVLALPREVCPVAFVLLHEKIRDSVGEMLEFFGKQSVTVKILSGDNLETVRETAKRAGVVGFERAVDMSAVLQEQRSIENEEFVELACNNNVFARVSPEDKELLVKAMQSRKHTVAMTGDGVNDLLALKEADCSITVAGGCDSVRAVSHFVLTTSDFTALPSVVAEGRRSINNLKRSASLFLTKTVYSTLMAIAFVFIPLAFPFEPIQLSLTGLLCTGFPSFILALQQNFSPVRGRILPQILKVAVPCGLTVFFNVLLITLFTRNMPRELCSTLCVITTGFVGYLLLFSISMPPNKLRLAFCSFMVACFVFAVVFMRQFFSLVPITAQVPGMLLAFLGSAAVFFVAFNLLSRLVLKRTMGDSL